MSLAAIRAFCRRLVAGSGPVAHPVYCAWCQVYRPGRPAIVTAWSSKPGTSGICPECRLRAAVDNRDLQEVGLAPNVAGVAEDARAARSTVREARQPAAVSGGSEGLEARPAAAEDRAAEADLSWSPLPARQAKCAGSSEVFPPAGPGCTTPAPTSIRPGPAPSITAVRP